jgi:hypothetical protein
MQPNKGLSGKDSFSSYQPADIFVHIRYPQMKPLRPAIAACDFDTLENEAVKKELEQLKSLMKSQKNKPFYILIRSGKIIFAVLFLPARLFLFRIPKWLIRNMLPKIGLLKKKVNETFKSFTRLIREMAAKLQVITQLVNALKPLQALLKNSFNNLVNNLVTPFRKINEVVNNVIKQTTLYLSKKQAQLASMFKNIRNKFASAAVVSRQEGSVSDFSIKTTIIHVIAKVKGIYKNASKKTSENLQAVKRFIQIKANNALKSVNFLKKSVAKVLKPVTDVVKLGGNKAVKAAKGAKKRISAAVIPKVQAITEAIQKSMDKATQILKPPLTLAVAMITQINQNIVNAFFNSPTFQIFKMQATKVKAMVTKVQRIQAAFLKSFERFRKHINKGFKKFFGHGKKAVVHLKSKLLKLKKKGKATLQKFTAILQKFRGVVGALLLKVLKVFVLTLRWCRIMIRFSGYLVREIYRELQQV